ncbi:hypothetical protein PFISCL1PPCAC_26685, partial [Pristionchus fissidentatus]
RQLAIRVHAAHAHDNNILLEKELLRLRNILRQRGYDSRNMSIATEYTIEDIDEMARKEYEKRHFRSNVQVALMLLLLLIAFLLFFVYLRIAVGNPEQERRELAEENYKLYSIPLP